MYTSDMRHPSPALEEKLLRLYALKSGGPVELSFRKPYLDLLRAFGNPHLKLPPVIHVAGTNGKGSITAMLRSILEAEGYRVHAYTSPHLCAFNERIYLAGKTIGDAALESLIDEALTLNRDNALTFFEITTAMAFAAFSRVPADILLLEVGLGGRLDCTNVIEKPLASVISAIGYDHMEFLGDTLEKIAAEKAGIIKPGCPCVIGAQGDSGVMKILMEAAKQNGSPLSRHGAEWFTEDHGDMFKYVHKDVEMILPRPALQGAHQVCNAGAVLAALDIIRDHISVSQGAICHGLQSVVWSARLEDITQRFRNLPSGWEIRLDGGHNADAARALAVQARSWKAQDGKPLHLILGMMNRKDPESFVAELYDCLSGVTCVAIPGEPNGLNPQDMKARLAKRFPGLSVYDCSNFQEAVEHITSRSKPPGRILIAGSLYLAGHVLHAVHSPFWVKRSQTG